MGHRRRTSPSGTVVRGEGLSLPPGTRVEDINGPRADPNVPCGDPVERLTIV